MDSKTLLQASLALPEKERVWLVERLMESLSPDPQDLTEAEWLAELDRRSTEFERDPSVGVPWSKGEGLA